MFDATLALTQLSRGSVSRLTAMIGANSFLKSDSEKWVGFRFKAKAKNKANAVRIVYDEAADLYNVIFQKIGNKKDPELGISLPYCKEVSNFEGLFADQLFEIFESETGLYLSL